MKLLMHFLVAACLSVCFVQPSIACGPYFDEEGNSIAFFEPFALHNSVLSTSCLHCDKTSMYQYGSRYLIKKYGENLRLWGEALGGRFSLNHIANVVYDLPIDTLKAYQKQPNTINKDYASNLFLKSLVTDRTLTPVLEYIIFAKQNEQSWNADYGWETDTAVNVARHSSVQASVALERYRLATNADLKRRYGFQYVRLCRYAGLYSEARKFYESEFSTTVSTSYFSQISLSHIAGIELLEGDTAKAMYLFSRVYDYNSGKRNETLLSISFSSDSVWKATLAHTKNPEEIAALWFVRSLKGSGIGLMAFQQVLAIAPASEYLEALAVREIGKLEKYVLTLNVTREVPQTAPIRRNSLLGSVKSLLSDAVELFEWCLQQFNEPYNSYFNEDDNLDSEETVVTAPAFSGQLLTLLQEAESSKKTRTQGLWQVLRGYVHLIAGQYETAVTLFQTSDKTGLNDDLKKQSAVLSAVAQLMNNSAITSEIEKTIVTAYPWLRDNQNQRLSGRPMQAFLTLVAQRYLNAGDVTRSAMCFFGAKREVEGNAMIDFYASDTDIAEYAKLLINVPSGSGVDSLLRTFSPLSIEQLYEVAGTKAMRQKDFAKALTYFEKIDATYWTRSDSIRLQYGWGMPDDEFSFAVPTYSTFTTNTGNDRVYYNGQGVLLSKLDFCRRVLAAERGRREGAKGSDKQLVEVGNLFFNTPFWAYSGVLWKEELVYSLRFYFSVGSYPLNDRAVQRKLNDGYKQFLSQYGWRTNAVEYYVDAARSTSDPELRAACYAMSEEARLSPHCSLHTGRANPYYGDETYYAMLHERSRGTKFYKAFQKQCPMFKDYVARW